MRNALRLLGASFGTAAALAGIEHGYFEILQGNVAPENALIFSMGAPCEPELMWHACEPALTIMPNFLITGILAIAISVVMLIWSIAFVQRKRGGIVLMLLCIPLLLFGGGIIPPVIAFIGGLVATRIHTPLSWWRARFSGSVGRVLARLWAFPLVIFMLWTLGGQWIAGHYFNTFLLNNAWIIIPLVLVPLLLAVFSGFAVEVQRKQMRSAA